MSDKAKCECCERTDVLTGINDRFYCIDHIDNGFKAVGDSVKSIRDALNRGAGESA